MKFLLIASAVIAAILFLSRPEPTAQAAPTFSIQPIAQPASPKPAACDCDPCSCEGCCLDYSAAR